MNKKEAKILDVLKTGGYFRKMLEKSYNGNMVFVARLIDLNGEVVKGHGYASLKYAKTELKVRQNFEHAKARQYCEIYM